MHLHDCDREMRIVTNTQKVRYVWILVLRRSCLSFPSQGNYEGLSFFPVYQKLLCKWLWPKKGKLALFLTEHVFIDMYIYIFFFCVFATTVCFGSLLNHHVEGVPPRDHLDQTMTLNNYNYGRMSSPLSTTHRPHFGLLQVHHPKHAGHSSKQSQIVGCPWTTRSTLGAASGNINPIGPLHMYLQDDSFRESDHLIPFESICAFFPGRKLEDKRQHAVDDHDCLYC